MRILLAIDDSDHSRAAVDVALNRRWPKTAEFRVVNVAEQSAQDRATKLLEGAREKLTGAFPSSEVTTEILSGSPKDALLKYSRDWKPDLIVMGTRGMRGIQRMVMGSVSEGVLVDGPSSVLIVTANGGVRKDAPLKNILVAVDNTEHSEAALHWLSQFERADQRIRVLTVSRYLADKFNDGFSATYSSSVDIARMQDRAAAKAVLAKTTTALGVQPNDSNFTFEHCEGDAAEQILTMAKTWPADLIVMGSRGLKGASKFWLGSVSQNVVLNASCPVEVVKQQ